MRQTDIICQGWYLDCSVEWTAVGGIASIIAAVATIAAVLVARHAWRKAKELDQTVAARAASRERRDATGLAVVLREELRWYRMTLSEVLPGLKSPVAAVAHLNKYKNRLELRTLREALLSLGCFDEEISRSLGDHYSIAAQIVSVIPEPTSASNATRNAPASAAEMAVDGARALLVAQTTMIYVDTLTPMSLRRCRVAENALDIFLGNPPTP